MPIGQQLIGPVDYTPALRNAGIRLDVGNSTPPIRRLPEVMVFGENKRDNVSGRGPQLIPTEPPLSRIRNIDLADRNEFDPSQPVLPDDDSLTPGDTPSPEQVKKMGGVFSKLGDILGQPGSRKLLAQIGMSINSARGLPTNIGEYAIGEAEQDARNMFRRRVLGGEDPNTIRMRGLSAEGRQSVLEELRAQEDRREAQQRERVENQQEDTLFGLRERAGRAEVEAAERANREAALTDPDAIVRNAAEAIGLDLPEGVNFSDFSREGAESFARDLANIRRTEIGQRASPQQVMSEAMRLRTIETVGARLQTLRGELASPRRGQTGTERATLIREIRDAENRILEAGGDPSEFGAEVVQQESAASSVEREAARRKYGSRVDDLSDEQLRRFLQIQRSR